MKERKDKCKRVRLQLGYIFLLHSSRWKSFVNEKICGETLRFL